MKNKIVNFLFHGIWKGGSGKLFPSSCIFIGKDILCLFIFNKGFEGLIIVPAVLIPAELLKSEKTDNEILSLVSEGIVLWDRLAHEDSF